MDVGGQAVAGDLVGLIEAARGNCVCQIGLHQVGGGQFRVFVDQFPGGDVSAVCRDLLAFLRMEIVEGSVVIEDRVKIEAVQLGDIAVREVFGLKILRKKNIGRCGSRGFLQKRRLPGRDVGIVSLSRSVCTGFSFRTICIAGSFRTIVVASCVQAICAAVVTEIVAVINFVGRSCCITGKSLHGICRFFFIAGRAVGVDFLAAYQVLLIAGVGVVGAF